MTTFSFPLTRILRMLKREHEVSVVVTSFSFFFQTVDCEPGSEDDESLREMVELAAQRLYDALSPVY